MMSVASFLGITLFTLVFTAFFSKGFSHLIRESVNPDENKRLSPVFLLIAGIAILMWYYRSWYPFVAEWPGLTPFIIAVALGIARYKHRDLFREDDDNPEEPMDPEPEV